FILLGIDRNNPSLILIGAISSALLALLFSLVIGLLEKAKLKTILLSLLVMIIGLGASYAPQWLPQKKQETLVVAGKMGVEPDILIHMYKLFI
ncbi:glycine/betaine ABC transporter permease, partial [Streptococcus suis]